MNRPNDPEYIWNPPPVPSLIERAEFVLASIDVLRELVREYRVLLDELT